ncbi:MAG: NAD(P)/FAD-dependent oxidoreductase [Nitrospirae bacterium]|nr:NAD(P)/FAD-dependent oxidoreductase [Nitrospirota bacterium]
MNAYDVVILGAGAAGMMCAIEAGRRGRRVALLEHGKRAGRKILISGGGRCNFTNRDVSAAHYVSNNPPFCKSALARYTPDDFIRMVKSRGILFHEKKSGQLFCNGSAKQIVDMLMEECRKSDVAFHLDLEVNGVEKAAGGFTVYTTSGDFSASSLVIATGGLSLPKLGATAFGYEAARKFGLRIVPTAPALDGFVLREEERPFCAELSGVSMDVTITCGEGVFRESLLFTHSGLSGPAALQASLYWKSGVPVEINLLPDLDILEWLLREKKEGNRTEVKNLLARFCPKRFSELFSGRYFPDPLPLVQISDRALRAFSSGIHRWTMIPKGTVGYGKAEVTRGGVDTDELSSKTMEAKKVPGLYFIGEVVDVTGWLGGYNFQWAWASGWSAGQVV